MKKLIVLIILFISSIKIFAQSADAIRGTWLSDSKDAKIEIYKSGDKYFGKIVWMKDMYEADGKTLKKDAKNSNVGLRSRSILNLNILTDFSYDDGEWNGDIYDPKSGKTYDCRIRLKANNLDVRGYVGSPMFGKSTTWTKVS